jgi:hypothetical protein
MRSAVIMMGFDDDGWHESMGIGAGFLVSVCNRFEA